jgi:putative ABC transport system substrate-binding protein
MRRRDFVVLVGATWTWPTVAFGQKQSIPVIGYLSGGSPGPFAALVAAFRQGLKQIGYVEGDNVAIEYRWAEGHYERLPTLAKDLVDRKVDLITASGGDLAARAAKNATPMIPIVANFGEDPVATGLIASLARPGGNLTGTALMVVELHAKRLGLCSVLMLNRRDRQSAGSAQA